MELGAFFLLLALLILIGLFVSRPFLEPEVEFVEDLSTSQDERERSALLAERDRILGALQELDFDYSLGKIPDEDYPPQRAGLMQRGADVLRRLDEMEHDLFEAGVEERIEAAIAERRSDLSRIKVGVADQVAAESVAHNARVRGVSTSIADPDDDLEVLLATRRRARREKAAGFCPKCGGPTKKSDQFCPKCGATLA